MVETSRGEWKPSKIPGVQYQPLNSDEKERSGTFMIRMAPNTRYPRHRHPGGEEVFVLKGDMTVGDQKMKIGDYLYSPPGSVHEASTVKGCLFLTVLPEPIEIIPTHEVQNEIDPTSMV